MKHKLTFFAAACCMAAVFTACEKNDFVQNTNDNDDDPFSSDGSVEVYGHGAVDLGLSVRWSTCNVGADKPENYGDYFAWGETEAKSNYSYTTYNYGSAWDHMTKYCTSSSFGKVDGKKQLETSDDVASVNWGGTWRMPTKAEQDELRTDCIWTWTTKNGVNGYEVKSKTNGYFIFLPAAGFRKDGKLNNIGEYGDYWSSSLKLSFQCEAYCIIFTETTPNLADWSFRYFGLPVRPVCE